MKNRIIKTATPLSLVVLLVAGTMPMESQANGDKVFFLSNQYGETLAFNSGVRGKPPYLRSKNQQRNQNLQSVEMSALEIEQGASAEVISQNTRKRVRSGHPSRAKRHSYQ